MLTSGAKYDVEGKVLALELQQLGERSRVGDTTQRGRPSVLTDPRPRPAGLAREGSDAVVAQFLRRKDELRASLHSRSLRVRVPALARARGPLTRAARSA